MKSDFLPGAAARPTTAALRMARLTRHRPGGHDDKRKQCIRSKAVRGSFFDIAHLVRHPDALEQAARFIDDGVIIIEAGKIRALHTWEAGRHHVPPSVPLSHFPGKLIVPGFIDCHVHYP